MTHVKKKKKKKKKKKEENSAKPNRESESLKDEGKRKKGNLGEVRQSHRDIESTQTVKHCHHHADDDKEARRRHCPRETHLAAAAGCSICPAQLRCSSLHNSQVFNLSFPSKPNKMFVNLLVECLCFYC